MNSDLITVSVLEAALAGLLLLTVVKETIPRKHAADATVLRGEQSMNTLYIIYGIVTVVCSLAIEVAGAFEGNKSIMVCRIMLCLRMFSFLTHGLGIVCFSESL